MGKMVGMQLQAEYEKFVGTEYYGLQILRVIPRERYPTGGLAPFKFELRCPKCGRTWQTIASDIRTNVPKKCKNCTKTRVGRVGLDDLEVRGSIPVAVTKSRPRVWCEFPTGECAISSCCHICCFECYKRQRCIHGGGRCENIPEKCGCSRARSKAEGGCL